MKMTDTISPAMAPVMRMWKPTLRTLVASLPRPTDLPVAHASGDQRLRILIAGSGIAVGWGVCTHELALPGTVARSLAAVVRRGVDVEIRADQATLLSEVGGVIAERGARRFDGVVLVVGFHEAFSLQAPAVWRRELLRQIDVVRAHTRTGTPVVVAGIPVPDLDGVPRVIAMRARRHAAALDAVSREVCGTSADLDFVPLVVPSGTVVGTGSSRRYTMWGGAIAGAMAPLVSSESVGSGPIDSSEEPERQRAVELLHLERAGTDPRIKAIVDQTRHSFGVSTAVFTVLDGELQHNEAVSGLPIQEVNRSQSFCNVAIQQPAGMIVEDASRDDRFRRSPLVKGRSHVRFYAGFPVEAPDGQPLGALCLIDTSARAAREIDLSLLREFAIRLQNELWRYLPSVEPEPRARRSHLLAIAR